MHTRRHLLIRAATLAVLLHVTPWVLRAQESAAGAARDQVPAVRIDSTLDLQTVIARALAVSPAVASGEAGVRTARSESRVASGAYLPSLTATSNALRSDVSTAGGPGGNGATSYSA